MVGTEGLRVHLSCAFTVSDSPCCACHTAALYRVGDSARVIPLFLACVAKRHGLQHWRQVPCVSASHLALLLVCFFVHVSLAQQLVLGQSASAPRLQAHACLVLECPARQQVIGLRWGNPLK